ncbi:uncharacterized protein LOC128993079 [Macrosteles quadrilineatus]|uniref:uncharacterized protein LOC128993079 n=1 Tax=Macrosteles quadrilineatus TaxID=74068 RepID=UPI0023E15048|nr:uncharacterized protein LOC128993079 [Macrosteles quadrilineatus]
MEVEEKFSDSIQFVLVPKREPTDEECFKNAKNSLLPQEEPTNNEDHREPTTEKVKEENQHKSQDFNVLVDGLLKDSAKPNGDVKVKSEQDTEEPGENNQNSVEPRDAEPNTSDTERNPSDAEPNPSDAEPNPSDAEAPSDNEISTQETVESESDSSESHSPKRKRRNTSSKTSTVVAATSNEIQTLSSDSDSEEVQSEEEKCTAQLNGVICACVQCNRAFETNIPPNAERLSSFMSPIPHTSSLNVRTLDEDSSAPIPEEVCTGTQDGILCQCDSCKMCVKKIELSIDKEVTRDHKDDNDVFMFTGDNEDKIAVNIQ